MNDKKLYIWQLANFLHNHNKYMSGEELVDHLNRNEIKTDNGTYYQGGRGVFKLIRETWNWLDKELDLPEEAKKVATVFVKADGNYAYED